MPDAGGLTVPQMVGRGEIDFASTFAGTLVYHLDAGVPVTVLAGLHSGCFELFAHGPIQSIGDLKGRRVGIQSLSSSAHLYMAIMAAQVGLDPAKDIEWVDPPKVKPMELFADGKSMPFWASRLSRRSCARAKIGRMILNTATDKPWSQYFCCMVFGNRDFVRSSSGRHQTLPARDPQGDRPLRRPSRAGRARSGRCRVHAALRLRAPDADRDTVRRGASYDPEDTMRFYALRLHEVGMIKSSPNALIAEGTDWRFLNELKRELKA